MSIPFNFRLTDFPVEAETLRLEVREFLSSALVDVPKETRAETWYGADEGFSRKVGERGWIFLLFMFITVTITFRSFTQAFAVFLTSLFGFAGVIWGHFIHGYQMSLFSIFGMIALIGIMVNDALVLISALNINIKKGMEYVPALKKAAISRFRPILLTSITTIAGLAPLIFEKSMQAQFLIPMAIAIAYGLIMATFLTLVFLPSVLLVLNQINKVLSWLVTGKVYQKDKEVEPAFKELKYERMIDDSNSDVSKNKF